MSAAVGTRRQRQAQVGEVVGVGGDSAPDVAPEVLVEVLPVFEPGVWPELGPGTGTGVAPCVGPGVEPAVDPPSSPTASTPASLALVRMSDREAELLRSVMADARSEGTRRAYATDVRRFMRWCEGRCLEPLPASSTVVLLHLASMLEAGLKLATINRAVVSISLAQVVAGGANPRDDLQVREFLKGLRRRLRSQPRREAAPLMLDGLRSALLTQPTSTRLGLRNRALLLVGWFGALRRSELVALDRADVRDDADGLVIKVRSSKTDQEGQGAVLGLPRRTDELCPATALKQWLTIRGDDGEEALFIAVDRRCSGRRLSAKGVERVLEGVVDDAGLQGQLTPHSLRAGFATQAARAGKPAHAIRRQTRHRSLAMLERYIREGEVFIANAGNDLV